MKLHRPLARALGGAALALVDELGRGVRQPSTARAMGAAIDALALAGSLGGFSLQAALAADVTTFLTTHVATLHVYSSLLVTAQIASAGALYRTLAFGAAAPYAAPFRMPRKSREAHAKRDASALGNLSRLEATVFGILALAPVALLLPTTTAFTSRTSPCTREPCSRERRWWRRRRRRNISRASASSRESRTGTRSRRA